LIVTPVLVRVFFIRRNANIWIFSKGGSKMSEESAEFDKELMDAYRKRKEARDNDD